VVGKVWRHWRRFPPCQRATAISIGIAAYVCTLTTSKPNRSANFRRRFRARQFGFSANHQLPSAPIANVAPNVANGATVSDRKELASGIISSGLTSNRKTGGRCPVTHHQSTNTHPKPEEKATRSKKSKCPLSSFRKRVPNQ